MKLTTNKKSLVEAVKGLKRIIKERGRDYGKVVSLRADSELIISANNDESVKSYSLISEIEEGGALSVDYSKLLKICSILKSSSILLENEDHFLIIREAGLKEYKINCFITEKEEKSISLDNGSFLIETDRLFKSLKQIKGFAAGRYGSPTHQSVFFNFASGTDFYELAALDGKRLGYKQVQSSWVSANKFDFSFLISKNGIEEILKTFDSSKSLKLQNRDNEIVLRQKNITLSIKKVDGRFPDFKRILNLKERNEKLIEVKLEELAESVKTVSKLAEKTNDIRLGDIQIEFAEKMLTVRGYENYETKEEVYSSSLCVRGIRGFEHDFEYSLNLDFLLDSLRNLDKGSAIELKFSDRIRPYILSTIEADGSLFQSCTMPVIFEK